MIISSRAGLGMGMGDVVTSLIVGVGDDDGAEFGGCAEKACHGDN